MLRDHEFRSVLCLLEDFSERFFQLWKERYLTCFIAGMVMCLRSRDRDSLLIPVDIVPTQRQRFAGNSQATKANQSDQQPPFSIGSFFDHASDRIGVDELLSRLVRLLACRDVSKRIDFDQTMTDSCTEPRLSEAASSINGDFRQSLIFQVSSEVISIAFRDLWERFLGSEVRNQVSLRVAVEGQRAWRDIGSFADFARQEAIKCCDDFRVIGVVRFVRNATLTESDSGEFLDHDVVETCGSP